MGVIAILGLVLGLSQTAERMLGLSVSVSLISIVVILTSDVKLRASERRPVAILLAGTFGLGSLTTLCLLLGPPDSAGIPLAAVVTFVTEYLLVCYRLLWVRLRTLRDRARRHWRRGTCKVCLLITILFTPFG